MRRTQVVLVGCLLLFLAGCVPERVLWSPDGNQALILGDDGLHVCDASGKLGPMLVEKVPTAAWLPDGKSFLATTNVTFATWKDFAAATNASPDKSAVDALRKELTTGDEKALAGMDEDAIDRAALYLRDAEPNLVPMAGARTALLGKDQTYRPVVCQRFTLAGNAAQAGPILFVADSSKTLELRVSHSGKYVALTEVKFGDKAESAAHLFVLPTTQDANTHVLDLGNASAYPDWDANDHAVVYYRQGSAGNDLATISQETVIDDKGELLAASQGSQDLASVLFDEIGRVRCAADGTIYFSALSVTLPASAVDTPAQPTIFAIHPGKQPAMASVIPAKGAEMLAHAAAQFFELSPDGKGLSIPSGNGRVAVLNIGTGELQEVQADLFEADESQFNLKTVPTWRSATELSFVRPGKEAPEVVRCDVMDPKHPTVVLSTTWDAAVKGDWLKPAEAPATTPASSMP